MDWTPLVQAIATAIVALVGFAMVVAIILLARHNAAARVDLRKLLDDGASLLTSLDLHGHMAQELAAQNRTDIVLASSPLLVLLDEPPPEVRDQPWAAVRVRNVGSGPALHLVVWLLVAGGVYRSAGIATKGFSGGLHLASGEVFEPGPLRNMLFVAKAHTPFDPGSAVVGDDPSTNLVAYCLDQFGNRYRFNLRTAGPSELWERGADAPSWAGAWDPRLSVEVPVSVFSAVTESMPQAEIAELLGKLSDVLRQAQ